MGAMNELINAEAVERLIRCLTRASPKTTFEAVRETIANLDPLSLRERSDLVSIALLADLPQGYRGIAQVFRRALKDGTFSGWIIWPVTETVTTAALADRSAGVFEDGLGLLAELTPRLSAEFAIRRFLEADLGRALDVVMAWTTSDDEHVRRMASEGTRSFLPWAIRVRALLANPAATLPILTALHRDPSDYVRRSVANHLNDLARQNADLVVRTAQRWLADSGDDPNTQWVVRHGLRTLIKKAHPGALALMGFGEASLTVSEIDLDSELIVSPGELAFAFSITNDGIEPVRLAVDYVIHFLKSNGVLSEKGFKLATKPVLPGETIQLRKRHSFRPITTRVYYPGEHAVELQVNGRRSGRTTFVLQL